MSVFAKVCPKCKHVHFDRVIAVGKLPMCGKSTHNGFAVCGCEGEQTMDYWA